MRLRWLNPILAVIAFAGCRPQYDVIIAPPPPAGTPLPIKSALNMVVEAQINGVTADILVDSGTVLTTLASPRAIERFTLRADGRNQFAGAEEGGVGVCEIDGGDAPANVTSSIDPTLYVADRLELGDVVIQNVAMSVLQETGYDTFAEAGVDIILSAALLVQVDWQLDREPRTLTLFPLGSRPRPEGGIDVTSIGPDLPFSDFKYGAITVSIGYGGESGAPIEFLVDTGGSVPLVVAKAAARNAGVDVDALPTATQRVYSAGSSCDRRLYRTPAARVGGRDYSGVVTLELPGDGPFAILGMPFLMSHERVYFAPAGSWIELAADELTDSLFAEDVRSFGMTLHFNADRRYEVVEVQAGSSAEAQGILVGEIVVSIDGFGLETIGGKSRFFGHEADGAGDGEFVVEAVDGSRRTVTLSPAPLL